MGAKEKSIQTAIRLALLERGVLVLHHHSDNRHARTGLGVGVADLICVVPPYGRMLCIEVKTSVGKTSPNQDRWLDVVRRHGAVAGVARCVDDALVLLHEAQDDPRPTEQK